MRPTVITNIRIKNFKSFGDQHIELGNLTLLSGLNNSGKSSVIQSLRMFMAAYNKESPLLSGYGSISDLRSDFVSFNESISIGLNFEGNCKEKLILSESEVIPPKNAPEFLYVGADRFGPRPHLPLSMDLDFRPKIGDQGEFVFEFITKLQDHNYLVPDLLVHPSSEGSTFEYVLQGWLNEIAPNVAYSFVTNKKADISHAEINNYRPANVGFGLSYTLPIIAATIGSTVFSERFNHIDLKADNVEMSYQKGQNDSIEQWEILKYKNGMLLVLENPEAHLHPQGQTAMGRMIALAAASGVQIVLETHSEHVMDGVRIAVKEGFIKNCDVKFHYLSKNKNGTTKIETPNLDENGKLDFWPEGFFDQTLKNRSILAKRKR